MLAANRQGNCGRTTAKAKAPVVTAKANQKSAAKAGSGAKAAKASPGYDPLAPARVREILARLDAAYPGVKCALHHSSAWELLVATILSAQCTDARVNMVTPGLFKKYPTPQAFAALEPQELEPEIRSTGFFRNKAKSLVGAARKMVSDSAARFRTRWTNCSPCPAWPARRRTSFSVHGAIR